MTGLGDAPIELMALDDPYEGVISAHREGELSFSHVQGVADAIMQRWREAWTSWCQPTCSAKSEASFHPIYLRTSRFGEDDRKCQVRGRVTRAGHHRASDSAR